LRANAACTERSQQVRPQADSYSELLPFSGSGAAERLRHAGTATPRITNHESPITNHLSRSDPRQDLPAVPPVATGPGAAILAGAAGGRYSFPPSAVGA
jgi:hypothetical protein